MLGVGEDDFRCDYFDKKFTAIWSYVTYWGPVTGVGDCDDQLGSDNEWPVTCLVPSIAWTNADILSVAP